MPIIETEFLDLTRDLDVRAFWAENELCAVWTEDKPRCSLSLGCDDHWLFEFLGVESTVRYYADKQHRDALHREANRVTLEHVGRAFFSEDTWEHSPARVEELFGCRFHIAEGGTPWLVPATADPGEFARILDRVEATDAGAFALTESFRAEWDRRRAAGSAPGGLGTGGRGPATIMTSVLKPETLFEWALDEPVLIARFRDLLGIKMVEMNRALQDFSGHTARGWWILDDNCALFSPRLYRELCMPVFARLFEAFSPDPAGRYQHSDSAMGHLLGHQREMGISRVNYGPELDVARIREAMPDAVIDGHMPPFLLRNGSPEAIGRRVAADFAKAGAGGRLHVTTAGSLAAGTGVGRMRFMMRAVERECRYRAAGAG